MSGRSLFFPALVLALLTLAPSAASGDPARVLVVKGDLSLAILADPAARTEAAAIVIRDGRIADFLDEGEPVPRGAEVLDVGAAFILPGLVHACAMTSDARTDAPDPITPDHLALDGFDPYARSDALLAEGITTVWLSPTRRRLMSGVGAVVRVVGDDRVLAPRSALRFTLGREGLNPPAVYRPPLEPDPFEDPLVPALPPPPTTRAAAVAMLRTAFAEAGTGSLAEARQGRLRVRVHANLAEEIRQAVSLVRELELAAVLELGDAGEAWKARKTLRDSGLPYVLEQGGADAADVLAFAGPGALARPGRPGLLALAASVAKHERDRGALRAVTIDAARAIGVDARVGSLDIGKDADLLIVDGSPLSPEASIRTVLARGRPVHEHRTTPSVVAVRAARLVTGSWVLDDVVIVCVDGVIREIGQDVLVPPDAERLVFDGTVVPGFVDAWSHVGLAPGDLTVPAADAARPDDAALAALRSRGVTSVALLPRGTGLVAGLASVVSTTLVDGSFDVLDREAALLVNVTTRGDRAAHALSIREYLVRALAYDAAFAAFEKAKAEAEKAGKKLEAKPPKRDARLDPWRAVAAGSLPLLARAERTEEIRDALTVLRDGFPDRYPSFAILGGTGAWSLLSELAEAKAPIVLAGWPGFDVLGEGRIHLGRRLVRAGVPMAIGGGGAAFSPVERMAQAIRDGISPRAALAAVAGVPAGIFGVQSVVGHLAPGFRADLVHLSADPGAPGSHVRHVLTRGRVVYERKEDR